MSRSGHVVTVIWQTINTRQTQKITNGNREHLLGQVNVRGHGTGLYTVVLMK